MNEKEKSLLNSALLKLLPYDTKVTIDFKGYLNLLPDEEPYKEKLEFSLKHQGKTIEDISQAPHILYSYPCSERFGMLRGYENEEYGVPVEFIKPLLRPLSDMTEEEEKELGKKYNFNINSDSISIKYHSDGCWDDDCQPGFKDYLWLETWLIIHKFDYLGLIKNGLALVAKKGMYNY
jgi:hypothetical protein